MYFPHVLFSLLRRRTGDHTQHELFDNVSSNFTVSHVLRLLLKLRILIIVKSESSDVYSQVCSDGMSRGSPLYFRISPSFSSAWCFFVVSFRNVSLDLAEQVQLPNFFSVWCRRANNSFCGDEFWPPHGSNCGLVQCSLRGDRESCVREGHGGAFHAALVAIVCRCLQNVASEELERRFPCINDTGDTQWWQCVLCWRALFMVTRRIV